MGSWNGTCGLSQLPIQHGDPVKVFLLRPSVHRTMMESGSGFCYPNTLYQPLFVPLTGEYNSYGSLEKIEDPAEFYFQFLKENSLFEHETYKDFEELIQKISYGDIKDVTLMFVHKELFEKSVASVATETIGYLDDINLKIHFESIMEKLLSLSSLDYSFLMENEAYIRDLPVLVRALQYSLKDYSFTPEALVESLLFERVLSNSRKFWSPQCGAGSQDSDFKIHRIISDYAIEKEKLYIEEHGEDYDS